MVGRSLGAFSRVERWHMTFLLKKSTNSTMQAIASPRSLLALPSLTKGIVLPKRNSIPKTDFLL